MRVAAVDVGTNSVRLLVAQAEGGGLRPVERLMTITRLGAGVDATGRLDDAALARTLDCIQRYAQRWRELRATRVRISATSAVRDATDRDRFFDGVRERAGVEAEVLSGEQEAATAFLGATVAVAAAAPTLVLDIGGGSTELIVGTDGPAHMVSRQLGCVRLTERCLVDDPPTPAQIEAAIDLIDDELRAAEEVFDPSVARTLVGVAGTVTTVGALHLGLETYQPERIHGTRVPVADVVAVTQRLAAMPSRERVHIGPMAPGREDVIVGGCLILQRVMQRYGFDEVLVSESDILDGLALQLIA
jgi:exopolyphosphatase / guanosine-5'-triphosphate,3'-diphosphate pyrophosphatase